MMTSPAIAQAGSGCMQAQQPRRRGHKPNPNITDKEREVIELISIGKTDYEMSIILGVTKGSIQNRIERACRVANVSNRTQLACKAIRMGWIR